MSYGIDTAEMIRADRVFLDEENPRHEPFEDQAEVIHYLCREEQVLTIAQDIATNGLNPLELFALIPEKGKDTYFAAEGNRRLCAVKLLNDPELAPTNLRNEFYKAAESWTPIEQLFCVVFDSRDAVRMWLDRIHAGLDEGRGRKQWRAEQKARNSPYAKNDLALRLLDYSEEKGFITTEERQGRLSTVQRYFANPIMRDTLGISHTGTNSPTSEVPPKEFDQLLQLFMRAVATKRLNTRDNAREIADYAHNIRQTPGITGSRGTPWEISDDEGANTNKQPSPKSPKPTKPKKPTKIRPNDELQKKLSEIPSYKLEKIYYSLCDLNAENHTPLLYVGAWSLLETLTALEGRNENTGFDSYLNSSKLSALGINEKSKKKAIIEAIKRLANIGNCTKHNETSAGFDYQQLVNDFEVIDDLLIELAKGAKTQKK